MRTVNYLMVFFLVVAPACSNQKAEDERVIAIHKFQTNEKALGSEPDSSLQAMDFTLPDLNGNEVTLSALKGDVVVLNYWATWCGPCIKELPDFVKLQEELAGKKIRFYGILTDTEGPDEVKPFIEDFGINYPQLMDDRTFFNLYGPMGVPRTFIINHRGEIAHIIISSTTKEFLRPLLIELTELTELAEAG